MIIVRRTSRTVFSSSWSRRKQAEMLNEWQNQTLNSKLRPVLLKGVTVTMKSNIGECRNEKTFGDVGLEAAIV